MKITKEQIKMLKDIASKLPKMYTAEGQETISRITGEKMIDSSIFKLSDGTQVSVNKTYIQKAEGGVEVNHFKRMMRIYKQGAVGDIKNYINEMISIYDGHKELLNGLNERFKNLQL